MRTSPLLKEEWMATYATQEYPEDIPECGKACYRCMEWYRSKDLPLPKCDLMHDYKLFETEASGIFDLDGWTEDEVAEYKTTMDPIVWAQVEFDWHPRWYQEELMRCSANRKAVRMGRRTGKTEALVVLLLWMAVTQPNRVPGKPYDIMVVVPQDNHADLVWDKLDHFISRSLRIKDMIPKDGRRQTPQRRIKFKNGTTIRIFLGTSGVRGQNANAIFFDEADYAEDSILVDMYPIIASEENVYLWVSTTPRGDRTPFWKWCTDKTLGFKEYHFPSYVTPNWSAQVDFEFRQQLDDIGYAHEVLADFADSEAQVFARRYIEQMFEQFQYSYKDCTFRNSKQHYRVMGVDWNDQSGIHIVICEWDPEWQALKLVYKDIVEDQNIAYHKAVERIIDIQSVWKCDSIYVDKGAGKMAMEHLMLYGQKHPGSGLAGIVKGVGFGERIEVRIPGTFDMHKKLAKPLIVNLACRRLEALNVAMPREEAVDFVNVSRHPTLGVQMQEFRIDRYNAAGDPIYAQGEEHTLIAWLCAVYGFVVERTDILDHLPKSDVLLRINYAMAADPKKAAQIHRERDQVVRSAREDAKNINRGTKPTIDLPPYPEDLQYKEALMRENHIFSSNRTRGLGGGGLRGALGISRRRTL